MDTPEEAAPDAAGKTTSFLCSALGVSGTTKVFVRPMKSEDGEIFVARVGIAIMGATNMAQGLLRDADPFSDSFHDNYAEGTGETQEEAIAALKRDIEVTSKTLWL